MEAGQVFVQSGIPFTIETEYDFVRQEPAREMWRIGERETQYGLGVDLNDMEGGTAKLSSCRDAIDARRNELSRQALASEEDGRE